MKNITDICKELGIEVPADKVSDLNKLVAENYKTVAEHEKKLTKLETERDGYKERAETAENTLKGFEGIDPEKLNDEIATWKKKAEDAEKDFQAKIEAREKEDALSKTLEDYEFSSVAAKNSVMAELRDNVRYKDGKLFGVADVIKDIQSRDASAFVDKSIAEKQARFTAPTSGNVNTGPGMSRADIMAIKDRNERRAAMAKNLHLFNGGNE